MAKAEATVEELVGMIERGELRLPEMQRRYVWAVEFYSCDKARSHAIALATVLSVTPRRPAIVRSLRPSSRRCRAFRAIRW